MAEFMTGLKRTHFCGDLRMEDVNQEVMVCGWVPEQRDLGQLIFIDLRDRTGVVQLAFDDHTNREIFEKAFSARAEFVLATERHSSGAFRQKQRNPHRRRRNFCDRTAGAGKERYSAF